MTFTTIKQSERLVGLGLNLRTADAYYVNGSGDPHFGKWSDHSHDDDDVPAWSLSALLKLMPEIRTEYGFMQPYLVGGFGRRFRFMCFYKITYNTQNCDEPIDAAYEMIVWLLENGHIKNENDTVSEG